MDRRQFGTLALGLGPALALTRATGAAAAPSRSSSQPVGAAAASPAAQVSYYGAFREIAPTSIRAAGWLAQLLQRQINGLAKNHAAQGFPYNTNLWNGVITPVKGQTPWWPYEQTGYLVDGLERLALVTGDQGMRNAAKPSLDYILGHPQADGTLGPAGISGMYWPHNVVFRALQAEYAATGNAAIPSALLRHYLGRPSGYGHGRDATNIEHLLKVYDATGDQRMLTMAKHTYDVFNSDNPRTSLARLGDGTHIKEHGVTFNETAKIPALIYLYTGERTMLDAAVNAYRKVDKYDMLPDGLHSAEETLRGNDVGLYHETCDVSDYSYSLGYLLLASGDATWADHIERCVFNAGLGSIAKDFKSLQYFSTPNQVQATGNMVTNRAVDRVAYRPGHDTQCCAGNVHRFLPNYAARQWLTARDGGIVAALYGPSVLSTTVSGTPISIQQVTNYPFSEQIAFTVSTARAVNFAFYVRIPGWTTNAILTVNGQSVAADLTPGTFVKIQRTFSNADRIELHVPMRIKLPTWTGGGTTVERGPLLYVLHIDEKSTATGGYDTTADFPAWQITPGSAWNYGLALTTTQSESRFTVVTASSGFPWETGAPRTEIRGPGLAVSGWTLPATSNPVLPTAPSFGSSTQQLRLVPYGSTRIRLSVFPSHGR